VIASVLAEEWTVLRSQLMVQRYGTVVMYLDDVLRLVQANDAAMAQGLVQNLDDILRLVQANDAAMAQGLVQNLDDVLRLVQANDAVMAQGLVQKCMLL
jgi:Cdc6-like AAA superfamily ATPase